MNDSRKMERGPKATARPEVGMHIASEPAVQAIEATLAEIWNTLLSGKSIGQNDNFFELGGHSIAAMRLVGRLQNTFDIDITVADIFSNPTIAQQAKLISAMQAAQHSDELVLKMLAELEADIA